MEESTLLYSAIMESSSLMRGGVRSREVNPKNKLEREYKESNERFVWRRTTGERWRRKKENEERWGGRRLKKEEEGPQFLLPLPVHFRFAAQIFFTLPPATKIFKALPSLHYPSNFSTPPSSVFGGDSAYRVYQRLG
jgi:hypothetical protein